MRSWGLPAPGARGPIPVSYTQLPLAQQKEFRQIKNAVIREAERLRQGEVTFEERDLGQQDATDQFRNSSYEYWRFQEIIREETDDAGGAAVSYTHLHRRSWN